MWIENDSQHFLLSKFTFFYIFQNTKKNRNMLYVFFLFSLFFRIKKKKTLNKHVLSFFIPVSSTIKVIQISNSYLTLNGVIQISNSYLTLNVIVQISNLYWK